MAWLLGGGAKKNAKRPAKDKSGTHTRMTTEESINLAVQVSLQEVNLPSPLMNTGCFCYFFFYLSLKVNRCKTLMMKCQIHLEMTKPMSKGTQECQLLTTSLVRNY